MFTTTEDYAPLITPDALRAISGTDPKNISRAERQAVDEAAAYLSSRYDTAAAFAAEGEARAPMLVMVIADITLYHLSASLPARLGSEIREQRYRDAIRWLKGVQAGDITPDLPRYGTQGEGRTGTVLRFREGKPLVHEW